MLNLITGDANVDAEVADAFNGATMRTSCTPTDKSAYVVKLQQAGHRVMMVGDGLNDAGALAQSDVGMTVSETSAALTPARTAVCCSVTTAIRKGSSRFARGSPPIAK